MAKHMVKCPKCGKTFDTNIEQAVKVSARRYGHASCYPDNKDFVPMAESQVDPDLIKLKEYISQKYGKNANWALINKQIKQFQKEQQYSLSGILKSLVYFYDVQSHTIDESNGGIGIVPYVYQQAYNYYYSLFVAKSLNENKDVKGIVEKVREITIPVPEIKEKKRFFNIAEDEVI
jgi:hypothetical protein